MKIQLSNIKPSPKPIRSSWDEAKMEELKWSLMEEGQVEPIGVHSYDHGYMIVWGHRRVEAARRAAWTEIEAVVVPQDEVNNLIQAGIENLAGEDMKIPDKAKWVYRLNVDLGVSIVEISRRSTVNRQTLYNWLDYKKEKAAGVSIDLQDDERDEGVEKTLIVKKVLGDDLESKKIVVAKINEDKLTREQTRAVAEAYRDAPTPELKQQVLKTPIISRDTAADILRRSTNRARMEGSIAFGNDMNEWEKEREEKRTYQDFDFPVKEYIDSARLFLEAVTRGPINVKYNKYSPEAARYVIRLNNKIIDALKNHNEALEGVK